jgi:homoserine dehydrogenase
MTNEHLYSTDMSEKRPLRVVLAGFGTVGQSVVRLLRSHHSEVELVAICNRNVARKQSLPDAPEIIWTESIDDLLAQRPDVFIELIGRRSPAESWITRALNAGISVVTANKQVIAECGPSLLSLAATMGCQLRFEAAVAGGVPVIRGIESGLVADHLTGVSGILNGTCNYILTRMEAAGIPFDDALREAQRLGFAEADPGDDIDGLDARAKIAILAMVALGAAVTPASIVCRSISPVAAVDFPYARHLDCTIRQVAWVTADDSGGVSARVGPALVPMSSALARAQGSENLVIVTGRSGGDTTFGGRGAGGGPSAVAVVSDVLAIARGANAAVRPGPLTAITASPDFSAPFYVRFTINDRPGIIAAIASAFARHDVNIDAVLQEPGYPADRRPFVVSVEASPVAAVERALAEMTTFDFHVIAPFAMPVLVSAAIRSSASPGQ